MIHVCPHLCKTRTRRSTYYQGICASSAVPSHTLTFARARSPHRTTHAVMDSLRRRMGGRVAATCTVRSKHHRTTAPVPAHGHGRTRWRHAHGKGGHAQAPLSWCSAALWCRAGCRRTGSILPKRRIDTTSTLHHMCRQACLSTHMQSHVKPRAVVVFVQRASPNSFAKRRHMWYHV